VTEILHERARRARERALILAWEYRQRNYSKGVWYRLRRTLVDAAEAWVIDRLEADRLEAEGYVPLPIGRELEPPKRFFLLTEEELKKAPGRRKIPVRLSGDLLRAPSLVLLTHTSVRIREQPRR